MAAEIDRPYVYIIRSNTPGVTLPIEMDPKYELMPSELRVTNSYGSKTARVRYLEKIQVGPDSLGGEIEQALRAGEQPFVVVDNVIKASRIFQLLQHLELLSRRVVISVSGLSGAGKSEFSSILGSYLVEAECPAYILSVDNYYLRTSAENTQYRSMLLQKSEESLEAYLGSQAEVDLARLSSLTSAFHAGATSLELRKMDLVQSSVVSDPAATDMENVRALIIEGTWSIEIEHVDVRIVLASRPDLTLLRRIKRGREPITPELEQVVLSEQRKLGQLRERCDIEIYDDYFVEFPSRRFRGGFSPRTSEGSTPSVEQFISTQHREMLTKRRKGQRITYSNEAPFCPIPSVSGQDASLHAIRMLHTMTVAQGILASSSSVINYHRIWARDSVITGLGGLLAKDEQLMQGLKASLDILARCAGPDGQIPSNVAVKESGELDGVSYGGLAG
ncbi:MAG: hypothetical protein KDD62_13480, partial [Bdellovibrionales bacterium]|nr:hypothetical protein [Bdellovibrionales bacterium]